MKRVFADTGYFVALCNRRDQWHAAASRFVLQFSGEIITTEFVLIEVGNYLCRTHVGRGSFQMLLTELAASPSAVVLPASHDLFVRGCDLYTARPDKEWSLTDCISFEVMTELELTDALTADAHFEQAGFRVLLKAEP